MGDPRVGDVAAHGERAAVSIDGLFAGDPAGAGDDGLALEAANGAGQRGVDERRVPGAGHDLVDRVAREFEGDGAMVGVRFGAGGRVRHLGPAERREADECQPDEGLEDRPAVVGRRPRRGRPVAGARVHLGSVERAWCEPMGPAAHWTVPERHFAAPGRPSTVSSLMSGPGVPTLPGPRPYWSCSAMPRRRARSANIVGVAIDGDVIRGTQLRRVLGRIEVLRCAEVEIPATVTDQGRIVDPDGFVAALETLWQEGGFRTKNVAFGIDGRDATFRRLELPLTDPGLVDDAARCELATYLPYEIDEAITVVHEVDRTETAVDVVAVAVRRSTVESIASCVASAGLRLQDLTLSSTALGLGVDGARDDRTIVSVELATTSIVVHRAGRATVTRVLTGGGGERAMAVADEIEQALASVDQFRQKDRDDSRADSPRLRRFQTVVHEVAAAIHFEQTQGSGAEDADIELTGAYGADEMLGEMMDEGTTAAVVVAAAPPWWGLDEPFATYATSTGVALNAFDGQPGLVHFDAPSLLEKRERRLETVVGVAAAAALAVAGAALVSQQEASAEQAADRAVDAEVEAEILAAQVDDLVDVADLGDDVLDRQRIRRDALEGEIWWPRVLDEVANTIPEETFLTGLTLRRPVDDLALDEQDATATFSAIALDQAGAADWLIAVEELDLFEDMWLLQSTASVYGELELPVVAFIGEGQLTPAARSPRSVGLDGEEDRS